MEMEWPQVSLRSLSSKIRANMETWTVGLFVFFLFHSANPYVMEFIILRTNRWRYTQNKAFITIITTFNTSGVQFLWRYQGTNMWNFFSLQFCSRTVIHLLTRFIAWQPRLGNRMLSRRCLSKLSWGVIILRQRSLLLFTFTIKRPACFCFSSC